MKPARKLQTLQHPQSLLACLRQFLTPEVWKQARAAEPHDRSRPRWGKRSRAKGATGGVWKAAEGNRGFKSARKRVASGRGANRTSRRRSLCSTP